MSLEAKSGDYDHDGISREAQDVLREKYKKEQWILRMNQQDLEVLKD